MELTELRQIDPFEFEEYVADRFRDKGYECYVTSSTGDFGVDVIAEKDNEKIAIQCKRYAKHNKVGVKDIYPIQAGKDFYDCNKAILVTTSSLNDNARVLCKKLNIEVWDSYKVGYEFLGIDRKQKGYLSRSEMRAVIFWCIILLLAFIFF